jgi:ribosome biogenesis GTPase
MSSHQFSLSQLGWRAHYSQQLSLEILERCFPARVANVHRGSLMAWSEQGEIDVNSPHDVPIAVGDWILIDSSSHRFERVLDRYTLLTRMASGTAHKMQLIAANLDTLFIVTSCNHDLNLSRLERYLAIAYDARVEPVIVLTKTDLCADVAAVRAEVEQCGDRVPVVALNALEPTSASQLASWLGTGTTVAFVGSSGVGKSTLVSTLTGAALPTQSIREDDSRGRHTTTSRQLIAMSTGAWLIDTPGMRELKIGAVEHGIRATFDDVESIALKCRYRDCKHGRDAGCAVQSAISQGTLDARRFDNYSKLQREVARTTQSVQERRAAERRFGKEVKLVLAEQRRERGRK